MRLKENPSSDIRNGRLLLRSMKMDLIPEPHCIFLVVKTSM